MNHLTEDQMNAAARLMEKLGGSFAANIAAAWFVADSSNRILLRNSFSHLFDRYHAMVDPQEPAAPTKHVKWVNIYDFGVGIHDTPEKAEEVSSGHTNNKLVARVRVQYEEGQRDGGYTDGQVIGTDNDGNAICWDAEKREPYNSGEPVPGPRVVISVSGGVVQDTYSNIENLNIEVFDFDNVEDDVDATNRMQEQFEEATKDLN